MPIDITVYVYLRKGVWDLKGPVETAINDDEPIHWSRNSLGENVTHILIVSFFQIYL